MMAAIRTNLLTKADIQTIKGIAIVAVIGIHSLVALPKEYLTDSAFKLLIIGLDQLFRFAVPVFVIISGYGLTLKYTQKKFELLSYYKKRLKRIIPIYVIWSGYVGFIISQVENWSVYRLGENWWQNLLLGQADYQFYFIPMLIQLYLIFPLLHRLNKNWLVLFTSVSLIGQAVGYGWMLNQGWNDQLQNIIGFSWLGYFAFGIFVAKNRFRISQRYAYLLLGISIAILICHTYWLLPQSENLFFSMRQTKWSVIPYSLSIFLFLGAYSKKLNKLIWLRHLGQVAFVLFVAHTTVLRFIQAPLSQISYWWVPVSFVTLLLISIAVFTPYQVFGFSKQITSGKIPS